ncbi:MAG: hypothetical protein IJH76_03020 [Clostridia bacterium]|nr:hypothetical protein [Clostridia bacterium]
MVFLFILLILAIIVVLFINAKIRIDVKEIDYSSKNKNLKQENSELQVSESINIESEEKINNKNNNIINIKIKFVILGFIPVFWQTINNKKIKEAKQNKKLQERYQKLLSKLKDKNILKINSLQAINTIRNNLDIRIKEFYLNLRFAIEDALVTSFLVPILSTTLAILFYKKNVKPQKQKYEIIPLYNSRKFNKYIIFRYI